MTIEEMKAEEERIGKKLVKLDPGSEEYDKVRKELYNVKRMRMEEEKLEAEFVSSNWRQELEENKFYAEREDNKQKRKENFWHIIADVGKVILAGAISYGGILLTAKSEEDRILNSRLLRWVNSPKY